MRVAPDDLTFFVVPVEQLDAYWEDVRDKVAAVKERTKPRWSVERVYHWVALKQAWLNVTYWKGELVGVTVVSADGDGLAVKTDALVLLAWADPRNVERGIADAALRFTHEQIEAKLRDAGYRSLRMISPRRGWLGTKKRPGLAVKLGFALAGYIFVKEL